LRETLLGVSLFPGSCDQPSGVRVCGEFLREFHYFLAPD
jgi:hypothetical protein